MHITDLKVHRLSLPLRQSCPPAHLILSAEVDPPEISFISSVFLILAHKMAHVVTHNDYSQHTFTPAIDLGPHEDTILAVYYSILVLGGCIGLPLILATALFARISHRRNPTLINLFLHYIAYAIACLLL